MAIKPKVYLVSDGWDILVISRTPARAQEMMDKFPELELYVKEYTVDEPDDEIWYKFKDNNDRAKQK